MMYIRFDFDQYVGNDTTIRAARLDVRALIRAAEVQPQCSMIVEDRDDFTRMRYRIGVAELEALAPMLPQWMIDHEGVVTLEVK